MDYLGRSFYILYRLFYVIFFYTIIHRKYRKRCKNYERKT